MIHGGRNSGNRAGLNQGASHHSGMVTQHFMVTYEHTYKSMRAILWKRLFATLCAVQLALVPLQAQSPAPPANQAPQAKHEQPVLKVTTRLVQVNVVVQDRHGQPVTDLTKDNFVVFDQKEQQKISTFSMESNRLLATPAQAPPPNFFSNRYEQKSGVPRAVTVVLLDGLNTQFLDMAYARNQVIKFLEQLQPQDRVALYTLTDQLRVLHDFTSDATSLLRVIQRYKGRYSHELAASEDVETSDTGNQLLDDFLNAGAQRIADLYAINRVQRTAAAIEEIANHLAALPGRKNLVWVSGAFPFYIGLGVDPTAANLTAERRTFSEEVERAVRALNNANLAIYPVDARGLIAPAFGKPLSATRGGVPSTITLSPNRANFDSMNILAERTGGRAYYNTNDIRGSIRRAIEDSRVTYVLGYYPTHQEWDGKFREIKVKVNRPGLEIRSRRGYFAFAEKKLDPKQVQAVLRAAISSPLDATDLGLTVRVTPVEIPGMRKMKTEFNVAQRDLTLNADGDRWVGALDVLFVQFSPQGKPLKTDLKTVGMNLTQARYNQVKHAGAIFTLDEPIVDGAGQLRVVVRDTTSGSLGSVSVPLEKLFGQLLPASPR
jgi:VWFA-related protein